MIQANKNSFKVDSMSSYINFKENLTLISICGYFVPGGAWSRNYVVSDQDSRNYDVSD